jgi:hypothetical protein
MSHFQRLPVFIWIEKSLKNKSIDDSENYKEPQ